MIRYKSEGNDCEMKMYELILEIIKKNGPASFTSICDCMNEMNQMKKENGKPVRPSVIKSIISRKKDLFAVENDIVSIRKGIELETLSTTISGFLRPSYKVEVNFKKKQFYFFEWYIDYPFPDRTENLIYCGTVDQFKKDIYPLEIWNWEKDYQQNSLVVDGTHWTVKLKTNEMSHVSEGLQSFPEEWPQFCQAVSNLIGIDFK